MKRTIWIGILLLCIGINKTWAQNDPVLAGMILLYTDKAEKELKNQEKVMLLQTTGHLWTKEEVKATTDLQREFNNYLDSFRSIVCYAAQIYGFYHEISKLTDNMGDFTRQVSRNSPNALAVALSTQRNRIYRELIMNSVEIVNDIRMACLSDNKMTEKERMEIVFGIRPEDVHDEPEFIEKHPEARATADVEVTELMGAETYLYLNCEGNALTARVEPTSTAKTGDKITIALDMNKMHLFDKETEKTILN